MEKTTVLYTTNRAKTAHANKTAHHVSEEHRVFVQGATSFVDAFEFKHKNSLDICNNFQYFITLTYFLLCTNLVRYAQLRRPCDVIFHTCCTVALV